MNTSKTVTKARICRHCGKPDWCYYFEDGLEICNRGSIATGWIASKKHDINGNPYLYEEKTEKPKPKIVSTKRYQYTDREGKLLARACRHFFDDGSDKRFRQGMKQGKWVNSCRHINREDIPIYRYIEIRQAIAQGLHIFWAEGEKCADAFWSLGIPATTNFGGSGQLQESDLLDLEGAKLVICPDRDIPGLKLAERVYHYYPHSDWLYVDPSSKFWKKGLIPSSDGYDIADWITEQNITKNDIFEAIEIYRGKLIPQNEELLAPKAEEHYTEKAIAALYSDKHYIAIDDNLHVFNGKYYEKLSSQREQRRIADWCRSNPVNLGGDRWKFAYASAANVNNIWSWLLVRFGVDPQELNPPGLNLNNGVLQITLTGKSIKTKLIPHDPNFFYAYCVEVNYDKKADRKESQRLLNCLDKGQQIILLRTLAASIDLAEIRKSKGREIKALLLQGEGSNGKDSVREVTQILFGESMVSLTVGDFQAYDQGRKFPLAKLANARISWASENTKFSSLENLQSLKCAITGDTVDIEQKNKPEYQIQPNTIFLFNCNESPSLVGGSEAIKSRWAILRFTKTFKKNANLAYDELEADPRFRYDINFLRESVAPAFLNQILEQLPLLLKEGIDYSSTDKSFEEIKSESNHLWQFVKDMGIAYMPEGKIYIKDLWADLKTWYTDTGTIEVFRDDSGKEKVVWHDQDNGYDKTIKGPNQIYKRFHQLFPKVKKMRDTKDVNRMGQFYLIGLGKTASVASEAYFISDTASELLQNSEALTTNSEALTEATPKSYQETEATEANLLNSVSDNILLEECLKRFSSLSPEMKQNFTDELQKMNSNIPSNSSSNLPDELENDYVGEPKKVKFKGEIFAVKKILGDKAVLTYPGQDKTIYMPDISKCEIIE
ncbi:MAG: DUF5906 domain-containing protein [Waterburya sp.]